MMNPRFYVENITFNDGQVLECGRNDILLFVGANNAGKSSALNEISHKLRSTTNVGKVISNITIQRLGAHSDFKRHFIENSLQCTNSVPPSLQGYRYNVLNEDLDFYISNFRTGLVDIFSFYVNVLTTEDRLSAADPPTSIGLIEQAAQHPIHYLQKDDRLELLCSNFFNKAFGKDLIVHRNAGYIVPLYVGERPIPKRGEDRVSMGYLAQLEKLDLLQEQGDGMRSFVGVLLNSFVSNSNILFIDEPEAFLHPPQAKLLGKMLASYLPNEKQLFLATHSEDFLKGLLDKNSENIKVIRINRVGSTNNVSFLDGVEIQSIWKNSLLRHSNILSGLFHSKVVICESDSDSRFYSAVLDALFEDTDLSVPDILFINVGGKHRIPVAIKALKKLNVPIKAIVDFDILNDIEPLKTIYTDLGGLWEDVCSDWTLVRTEIESKRPEFLTSEVRSQIEEVLQSETERKFSALKVNAIQKILKKPSPWTEAKKVGKAYIPSGDATKAFERMQNKFVEAGLLIPEVGELESFVKSVGNHGPKWINEVLAKDLKNDSELLIARTFVKQIVI